jgi:hypothetical protein
MELEQYQDQLEFQPEYPLTSEPLEIDVVILKKAPKAVIDKNIARIFKRINLLEYKSPEDYFSVKDFYKVSGYAFLYAALNHTPIEEMTVSIIETRHPRELLKYLREHHCSVTETSSGVYVVSGYPMAIQVIERRKLSLKENLWLKGLSKRLKAADAATITIDETGFPCRIKKHPALQERDYPIDQSAMSLSRSKPKSLSLRRPLSLEC